MSLVNPSLVSRRHKMSKSHKEQLSKIMKEHNAARGMKENVKPKRKYTSPRKKKPV